jgi:cell division protein FtsZ
LLEASIEGATGILLNITGGKSVGLFEVNEAAGVVTSAASADANIIFGAVIDKGMDDELRVTVIATGFGQQRRRKRKAAPERARDREPALATTAPASEEGGFDIPKEVLDVPSFLRDS